jgi:hypothetical protein
MILAVLPDFCVEKAAQEFVAGDAVEAGGGEGGLGVGEVGDAKAGEDAEGEIEGADVEGCEGAEERGWGDGEVGEEPEGAGGGVGGDVVGKGVELGLGEAVEEEVGGDEVGRDPRLKPWATSPLFFIQSYETRA